MSSFFKFSQIKTLIIMFIGFSFLACNDTNLVSESIRSTELSENIRKNGTYPYRYSITEYEDLRPIRVIVNSLSYDNVDNSIKQIIRQDTKEGTRVYSFEKNSDGIITKQTVTENQHDQYYYLFTYQKDIYGKLQISNIKAYTMEGVYLGANIEYNFTKGFLSGYTFSLGNNLQYITTLEGRGNVKSGQQQQLTLNGNILFKSKEDFVYNEKVKHPFQFKFLGVLSYLPYEEETFPIENITLSVMPISHVTYVGEGEAKSSSLYLYEYGKLTSEGYPMEYHVYKTNLEEPGMERKLIKSVKIDYR